jgi:hemoglobin-like flavoprotein
MTTRTTGEGGWTMMNYYDIVQESYMRCRQSPGFFDDFYRDFIGSSDEVKKKFAKTDLGHQEKLLSESMVYMILFAEGGEFAGRIIAQLGEKHNRHHNDITPALYALWLESLIRTLKKHDPQMSPELEQRWREAMTVSIEALKARY